MIRIGIDLYFTEKSLQESEYALCREYRKPVGLYLEKEEFAEFDEYRDTDTVIYMPGLKEKEEGLWHELVDRMSRARELDYIRYCKEMLWDLYGDERLEPYLEEVESERVLFEKMPLDVRRDVKKKYSKFDDGSSRLIDRWYTYMDFGERDRTCYKCAIRPVKESNCYVRFSSYPGIADFKAGFAAAVLYAPRITRDDIKKWWGFPGIRIENGEVLETPVDKLKEVHDYCSDVEINKIGEEFFHKVYDMFSGLAVETGATVESKRIPDIDIPIVDAFLSRFIYREEPYSKGELRTSMPYFEFLSALAKQAVHDTDTQAVRSCLMSFEERINTLHQMACIADKFDLELHSSW